MVHFSSKQPLHIYAVGVAFRAPIQRRMRSTWLAANTMVVRLLASSSSAVTIISSSNEKQSLILTRVLYSGVGYVRDRAQELKYSIRRRCREVTFFVKTTFVWAHCLDK